jgi:DNA topoisomerase-6 subunit A
MESKEEVKKKIREMGRNLLKQISKQENPYLDVPIRALSNVSYDPKTKLITLGNKTAKRYLFNVAHIRKFAQTLGVAGLAKQLINEDKHLNIREAFYALKRPVLGADINLADEQEETNAAIEDLELILDASREQLHFNADKGGFVAGKVIIQDRNDVIDWSKLGSGGWSIPSNVEDIKFKKVDAKYVIYLEKAATWERLNEDKVWEKLNCIIVCSRGQAPRGVRRLLQRLNFEFGLPIYVLVDLDPWGTYIYSVLKFGSISLAHISEKLAIPDVKYLGLTPDDIVKYKLEKHKLPMKDVDTKRLEEVSNYEWFKHDERWVTFFKKMAALKGKVELAALTSNGISFISEKYIPEKIKNKDWID